MLTVEIRDAQKAELGLAEVEIFCDADGLELLMRQLDHLKHGSTHIHLMTPAWAGNELAGQPFGEGTALVNHLRVTLSTQNKTN